MSDPLYPLGGLGLQIKAHWKKYRPKMYAELEKSGHLEEAVYHAKELTSDALYDLTANQGLPRDRAEELVMHEWAFLPSEQEQPSLNFDPLSLASPQPDESPSQSPNPSESPHETSASPTPRTSVRGLPGRRPPAT